MGIWKKKFSVRDNAERGKAAEDLFAYEKGLESEEEVKKTIIILAENLKIITEPGGVAAAAAVLHKKINVQNKNVVVMISGGNIDLDMFTNL